MTLDASSLLLIRHDCVNSNGLGDGQKAWQLLQQRFRSDETITVISLMRQLARLQLREDKAIHQYFIRAQELVTRLHHAGEELSETLFNAMVLNGLPQRHENFVVQESFNPAENFVELRKRLTNFEESHRQRDDVERISTLPCQQRMLLIKLVYTLHSNHILERLSLSLVVQKALDCVLYVTNLDI